MLAAAAAANAADAALAEALVAFEADGEWQGAGIRSFGHWCDVNLGLASRPALRLTRAAGRLPELPAIAAAFGEGALSVEKVQLVAEVAGPATDEKFATIARQASVSQLQRICAEYRKLGEDETSETAERRHARRGVRSDRTDDGLVRIVALLEPDEVAIVLAALDTRRAGLARGTSGLGRAGAGALRPASRRAGGTGHGAAGDRAGSGGAR